jgi:nicotinate-nucleotide adenylyltransferase
MSAPKSAIPARYATPAWRGRRIGLFGGSFNPPHLGHRAIALAALKALKLDEIWWLVSPQNPLKDPRETSDFEKRLAQTRAIANHPRFVVTDLEARLGTRTTAETLASLGPMLRQGRFVWIMGADSFAGLHRWNRWKELPARLPLAVLDRPGQSLKALTSPAARLLARRKLRRSKAAKLIETKPPCWVFLKLPLRSESSSAIRQAGRAIPLEPTPAKSLS